MPRWAFPQPIEAVSIPCAPGKRSEVKKEKKRKIHDPVGIRRV
jgi:hypothetical protein